MRIQLAEDAVSKAKISLEATRLDCAKQKKRLNELRRENDIISTIQSRGDYARDATKQLRSMEEEPNISFMHRAERIRRLVEPVAEWSNDAKALLVLIELEMKTIDT